MCHAVSRQPQDFAFVGLCLVGGVAKYTILCYHCVPFSFNASFELHAPQVPLPDDLASALQRLEPWRESKRASA